MSLIAQLKERVVGMDRPNTHRELESLVGELRVAWSDLFHSANLGISFSPGRLSRFSHLTDDLIGKIQNPNSTVPEDKRAVLRDRVQWYRFLCDLLRSRGVETVTIALEDACISLQNGGTFEKLLNRLTATEPKVSAITPASSH